MGQAQLASPQSVISLTPKFQIYEAMAAAAPWHHIQVSLCRQGRTPCTIEYEQH